LFKPLTVIWYVEEHKCFLCFQAKLPDSMPPHFSAMYTPIAAAGTQGQIRHVARLIATQLTAVGLGPGARQAKKLQVIPKVRPGHTMSIVKCAVSNAACNNSMTDYHSAHIISIYADLKRIKIL
jgi:hypothetical protein